MTRLLSRFLPMIAASLLAMTAVSARADDYAVSLTSSTAGTYSGASSTTIGTAGSFTDTYTFSVSSGSTVVLSLVTISASDEQLITFSSATLNGQALTIDTQTFDGGVVYSFATLTGTDLSGDLTLTVTGTAGGSLATGTSIAASYSGTYNVLSSASAVPEPTSNAMFAAGLFAVGLMLYRRRGSVRS